MTVVEGSSGSVQEQSRVQCNHLLATTFCAKLFGAPCGSPGALGRIDHKILCKTFLGFPCIDYLATASSRTSGFKRGRCQSEMQSSFAGKVLMESESFAGVEAAAFQSEAFVLFWQKWRRCRYQLSSLLISTLATTHLYCWLCCYCWYY